MGTFVRAVITGFGFTLGKTLFDRLKNRYMPDKTEPQEVIVVDPSNLDGTEAGHTGHASHAGPIGHAGHAERDR